MPCGEVARNRVRHLSVALWSANSMSMNLRHAAALALVGWYLMIPPIASNGRVDSNVSLRKWWKFEIFDSAQECWATLSGMQGSPVTDAQWEASRRAALELRHTPTLNRAELKKRLSELLCVQDDDPRLKEK
jgi:hypothetical protein